MILREYDPVLDAGALASHFRRCGYGPHHGDTVLDDVSMEAILTERVHELFIVAEDGGQIAGCIGFMRGSGRRVTRDNELYAGLFVLDPRHRNSLLAGNLFMKSFEILVTRGIRTLRIEANPTNTKAYPIYLRAGFRARPDARPDEDGYVELVSHLPGVVCDLLASDTERIMPSVLPKFSWRNAGSGRSLTPTTGVNVYENGRTVVTYELSAGEFRVSAVVDLLTGETYDYKVLAGALERPQLHLGLDIYRSPVELRAKSMGMGFHATIDSWGSLRVYSDSASEPIIIDHWPVLRGRTPTGWRRPYPRNISFEEDSDRWLTEEVRPGSTVRREITVSAGKVSVSSKLTDAKIGSELMVSPWVGMRQVEKYMRTAKETWIGGPVVRGIWPDDYTDFEACADLTANETYSSEALWCNESTAVQVRWHPDTTVRHEGNHLPQFRQNVGVSREYEVAVSNHDDSLSRPPTYLSPTGISVEKIRTPSKSIQKPSVSPRPAVWRPSKRYGKGVLESTGIQMLANYSESAKGLVGWSDSRSTFLVSPYPAVRNWGPLSDWAAGLWAGISAARHDTEQGVEWAGSTEAIPLVENLDLIGTNPGWAVELDDSATPTLDLCGRAGTTSGSVEFAFYMTPALSAGAPILMGKSDGGRWVVDATKRPWSVGTSMLAGEIGDGRYMVITPVEGKYQEIFVRSEPKGIHLTLLSELSAATSRVRWRIKIVEHRAAALKEMNL